MEYYFKLRDMNYEIDGAIIDIASENDELLLLPEVNATNDNGALGYVSLYHNEGFSTNIKELSELLGKKYVWDSENNEKGEDAGTLYVLEHENVTKGVIEILEVTDEFITIKWTGLANVYWDEDLSENVPFETVFKAEIQ